MLPLILLLVIFSIHCGQAGNDHYFQYANVPAWNAYEFGYNRGNPHHFTSRFEKAHGWTFKTKVRWGDKHGWGESYWDYNHGDNNKKKGHDKGHHKGWSGSASEDVGVIAQNQNQGSRNIEHYEGTNRERNYQQYY